MGVRQGMRVVVRLGVLALALGIAARTTAADVIRQASGGFYVGEVRRGADGDYRKLIASFSGWTVWETAVQAELICLAIKAGNGRLSPVPDAAFGFVAGDGGGFFLRQVSGEVVPAAAFYGSHAFVKTAGGEVGSVVYDAVPIAAARAWEGRSGLFEVASGPHRLDEDALRRDTGAIDFSGITRALSLVASCAAGAPTV